MDVGPINLHSDFIKLRHPGGVKQLQTGSVTPSNKNPSNEKENPPSPGVKSNLTETR